MDKSLKWTSRGTSQCPQCHNSYSNAWKPKNCKHCSYEIGGEHVPSAKRLKADSPHSVLIVDSETIKIFSVHLNHREKRVFVVKRITSGDTTFMCHHKKCVESRAVHQASSQQFTCDHIKATETYDPPPSAKNFFVDDITSYKCDASTREQLTKMLVPPEDFRHLVSISDSCCAIYTSSSPSNPVGYCHCTRGDDGVWLCSSSSCNKKGGRSKQTKTRTMCSHLHVLYCILKPDAPLSNSLPTVDVSHDDSSMSTSRKSTIKLGLTRTVPYPVPPHILQAFRKQLDLPSSISPSLINCELCGSSLVPGKHPGRADSDASYILTPWAIKTVNVSVKFCTHRDCKAMHQAWPIDQGLFNICDKLFVALEILVHWRELFKRGVPLTVAIESHLAAWTKSGEITFTDGEQKYITSLLYNGFYAFELMSERCLDSVICGVCGIVGQVYYGDGNEKNCCSIEKVDYNFRVEEGQEQLPSLEDFMLDLRKIFTEKNMFSRSLQDDTIKAVHVPPIIAPSMRGETVVNTEMEKKSIYLNGGFFDKDKIIGDPMMLHQLIRSKNLDMSSLEQMTRQDLDTICRECKIDNASTLTKALAVQQLQTLYSSLLTGSSPCHGFTQVRGHSGGFYHMVCRHGTTVASKFLLLQESVRDAADLYLSLKHPPPLLVNDTPCGFSRHVDLRAPETASLLWGANLGCFEEPSLKRQPKQVSVPELVPSEFSVRKLDEDSVASDSHDNLHHPLTQSTRRYVVGDRFHTSTNPHKSKLCEFHNINLCLQKDTIKTSYQECMNNSKNLKRLRSSTQQSFPIHFVYNFLMDFYHNEGIVEKQRKDLTSTLKDGQTFTRDKYLRFKIVDLSK